MKDSGIKWIGQIPDNWEVKKIKYQYQLQTGFTPDTAITDNYDDENGHTWVSIADMGDERVIKESVSKISDIYINEKHPELVRKGSLLYSFKLSVGKVAFAGKDFYTNEAIASFKNTKNICLNYLYYASFLIEENANINIYGAKILNQDLIKNSITIIPPIKEQQKIAEFLDKKCAEIDEIIAKKESQITAIENYKKSLITELLTKGLNKNSQYKYSGYEWIGQIPINWQVKKLKYVIKEIKVGPFGSALSNDDFKNEGYWVYNQRTVLDNNYETNDTFIDEQKYKEMAGFKVKSGDLLITTRGTIGKVSIVPKNFNPGIIHPCIIRFRCDEEKILPELIKIIFNDSTLLSDQLNKYSNATTIDVIYSYTLKDTIVPIIPMEEQKKLLDFIKDKASKIDIIIKEQKESVEILKAYKKSLIYEYVTGKKEVV